MGKKEKERLSPSAAKRPPSRASSSSQLVMLRATSSPSSALRVPRRTSTAGALCEMALLSPPPFIGKIGKFQASFRHETFYLLRSRQRLCLCLPRKNLFQHVHAWLRLHHQEAHKIIGHSLKQFDIRSEYHVAFLIPLKRGFRMLYSDSRE